MSSIKLYLYPRYRINVNSTSKLTKYINIYKILVVVFSIIKINKFYIQNIS